MKILVIGSGAREHALVWKIKQSPLVEKIWCAPGNPGIAQLAECIDIPADDIPALLQFAREHAVDLTVPGPEAPLVQGLADEFEAHGLSVFGPSMDAAELEGSKAFAKYFMDKYKIPTADCIVFEDYDEALAYVRQAEYPCVVKADGLAAGKGVVIAQDVQQAEEALQRMMVRQEFGAAGGKVVIEEYLQGEEVSVFAVSDGENFVMLVPAQDYKPAFDDDQGPNTGGMGAYAPAPLMNRDLLKTIKREVVEPSIRGMSLENRPFIGVLYVGLMITESGPEVLEYNCRFGDPETQVVLPLLASDLVDLMQKAVTRQVIDYQVELQKKWALTVVVASGGYPGAYQTGKKITGLDEIDDPDVIVFHSGTKMSEDGIVTAGGRVLSVTAMHQDLRTAHEKAYAAVQKIRFDGAFSRKDIGLRAFRHLG